MTYSSLIRAIRNEEPKKIIVGSQSVSWEGWGNMFDPCNAATVSDAVINAGYIKRENCGVFDRSI